MAIPFRFATSGQQPLLLQLGSTGATQPIISISEVNCGLEKAGSIGGATEPQLIRPGVLGTGKSVEVLNPVSAAKAALIQSFITLPSVPDISTLPPVGQQLCRRKFWFPEGSEMLVMPGGAVLLYAFVTDVGFRGNTWMADLTWEEI